ncbi:MAG TPA: alpha/beta fold hydrolase [Devosia sp.]|nr:alpha/beta fold hydrolase [Devosia sp.]
MTRQVLFVQGGGSGAHDEWDSKLVASLTERLGAGYDVRYPLMPNEGEPRYAAWKAALIEQIDRLDDGAIVVGHSIGAAILINTLAEHAPKQPLGGIFILAAPFIGDGGWPSDEIQPRGDLAEQLPSVPVFFYHGTADEIVPFAHLQLYASALPQAAARALDGRDHQLGNDLSEVAEDIRGLAAGLASIRRH